MTAPGARSYGEREFMNPRKVERKIPVPKAKVHCSNKDGSPDNLKLPRPFQPRPKVSRTPPNVPEGFSSQKERLRHNMRIMVKQGNARSDDPVTARARPEFDTGSANHSSSKHSISFNSPSLSIEYPPGATVPRIKPRTKFQFKKTHYQRFVGTSSAQKVSSYQISKWRTPDATRSNSIVSDFHDSQGHLDTTTTGTTTTGGDSNTDSNPPNQASLPPSPPSDHAVASDAPRRSKTSIVSRVSVTDSNQSPIECWSSNCSSSPSIIQDGHHTTTQCIHPVRTKGRAPWNIHEHVQIRQAIEASTPCVVPPSNNRALSSSRVNFANIPKKRGAMTFGTTESNKVIDPDRIRMSLSEYDKQKGQNLEELFRPKKGCFRCVVL